MDYRVILYHKQATSARTRFLKFSNNSVCAFDNLPKLAQPVAVTADDPALHPAAVLTSVERKLGLASGDLQAEGEYRHTVEVPGGRIAVILAGITTIDPPFELAERAGATFIDLTQARGLPQVELELLRHAYELLMGG